MNKQFYCEQCDLEMTGKQAEKHTHPTPSKEPNKKDGDTHDSSFVIHFVTLWLAKRIKPPPQKA